MSIAKEKAREYLNKYISNEFDLDEEIKIHPKRIEKAIDIAIAETFSEVKKIASRIDCDSKYCKNTHEIRHILNQS